MLIRAPKFWYTDQLNPVLKYLLCPISNIYSYFTSLNYKKDYKSKSAKARVIAIGGITAGGSGKTAVAASICEMLNNVKKKSAVLSRGFGRSSNGTFLVDAKKHNFKAVGDEPLLLSRYAEVFVGADRSKTCRMAEQKKHDIIILDDGLTQRDLKVDAKFVVIDSSQGFGNGYMLPLGPNRLNFDIVSSDITAVIIIKNSKNEDVKELMKKIPGNIPIIQGYMEQDLSKIKNNERVLAFCGIGYPQKFFDSLKSKLNVIKAMDFPDHYPFTDDDITDVLGEAKLCSAKLVTTEKDLVRIPKKYHSFITAIPVKVVWQDAEKLFAKFGIQ
jgi:tetraacyldisaccharide 4'-kinase